MTVDTRELSIYSLNFFLDSCKFGCLHGYAIDRWRPSSTRIPDPSLITPEFELIINILFKRFGHCGAYRGSAEYLLQEHLKRYAKTLIPNLRIYNPVHQAPNHSIQESNILDG